MQFLLIIFLFVFPNVSFSSCPIGPGMNPTIFPLWARNILENIFKIEPAYFIQEKMNSSMIDHLKSININTTDSEQYKKLLKIVVLNQDEKNNIQSQDITSFEKTTETLSQKEKAYFSEKEKNFILEKIKEYKEKKLKPFLLNHEQIVVPMLHDFLTPKESSKVLESSKNFEKQTRNHAADSCSNKPLSFVNQSVSDSAFSSLSKGWYSSIKKLELIHANYNPAKLEEVPATLEELIIHSPTDTRFKTEELIITITKNFKNLKKLELVEISPMTSDLINQIIEKLPNLRELNLINCGINSLHFQETPAKLTHLNLSNNSIDNHGASEIAQMKFLTQLHLAQNQIGDEGASILAQTHSPLTSLDLSDNQIGHTGASDIAQMKLLTQLHLAHNQIGNEGASKIAQTHSPLTSLDLSHNQIDDQGAQTISKMKSLLRLYLNFNKITSEGAQAIFQTNAPMTQLELRSNKIDLSNGFQISKIKDTLTYLDLSYNQIGDKGAEVIAKNINSLTHLGLSNAQIGNPGTINIAQMKPLTDVNLSNNQISDEGAYLFAERAHRIKNLYLSGNDMISEAMMKRLNQHAI